MGQIMIFLLILSLISCAYIVVPLLSTKNKNKTSPLHLLATFSSLISVSIILVIVGEYYFDGNYMILLFQ